LAFATVLFSSFFTPPVSALPKSYPSESNNSTFRDVAHVSLEKEIRSVSFFSARPLRNPFNGTSIQPALN